MTESVLYGPGIATAFPGTSRAQNPGEMTGMSPVRRYKDAERNCIRREDFLRGLGDEAD